MTAVACVAGLSGFVAAGCVAVLTATGGSTVDGPKEFEFTEERMQRNGDERKTSRPTGREVSVFYANRV